LPGRVEKLIKVPIPDTTGANPLPTSLERVPSVRARFRATGLSRQHRETVLHHALHDIEPHHLELERRCYLQFRVDGNEIVLAVNLKAMAGEEE
jgi:hypothetical protein